MGQDTVLATVKKFKNALESINIRVDQLILFGSYAEGTAREDSFKLADKMNLFPANYISSIKKDEDNFILVNNLHRTIVIIKNDIYYSYKGNKISDLDDEVINELIAKNFLYKTKNKEYDIFVNWLKKHQDHEEYLNLTILTTNNCNLQCQYCYEKGIFNKRKNISKVEIEKIISFFEIYTKRTNLNKIHISFYGGEPLLNYNAIVRTINNIEILENKAKKQPTPKKPEVKIHIVKESVDLNNPHSLPADCATHAKKV